MNFEYGFVVPALRLMLASIKGLQGGGVATSFDVQIFSGYGPLGELTCGLGIPGREGEGISVIRKVDI